MKRRRMAAGLAALALSTGLIAAGCGSDSDSGSDTNGGSAGGDVGELKVGVLVPLTGDLSPFGGPNAKAAQLGADTVNQAAKDAGVDLTMALTTEDSKTDPQGAQEAATKLVESDGVNVIAGPMASSETIPVAENVSVDAGVPLISPSATSPEITGLDDNGLVFRTPPSDALQGKILASVLGEAIGADATVNTGGRNDAYGTALVEEFTKAWEAGGGKVGLNVPYNPDANSLDSEAGQLAGGSPGAWVVIDFPDSWQKMGPALLRTGKWQPAKTWTADGLRSPDLPKKAGVKVTEGMQGTVPTSKDAPAGQAFDDLWKAEIKTDRQTYDAQMFDAVVLYALAAVRTGSTDGATIAGKLAEVSGAPGTKYTFEQLGDALKAVKNGEDIDYEGASGPIDLDANGDPASASYGKWVYQGGKLVDSDEVFPVTGD
ncbi:MAG: ABC transporter substrate-binding protein [Thermoleophilia bacterium]|nr:ABC transporter substrate-binding protein [Thermoleophilia bacterium]